MTMPWPLARDFATVASRIERDRMLSIACAARAAQADEKGWSGWINRQDANRSA